MALKKKAKDKVTKKKSDSNDSKKVSSSDNKTKEDSDTSSDSNDDVDNDLDDESDTIDVNSNVEYNEGTGSDSEITNEKKLLTGDDWNNYFKNTYGSKNVQWESAVKSMDDILDVPSDITKLKPQQLADLAKKEGWVVEPLGKGRKAGIPFEEGGGMSIRKLNPDGIPTGEYIQYHPGSTYHDSIPYYKVSYGNYKGPRRFELGGGVVK
ncbi:MAG: hypothetical protein ABF289_08790 [Clostridiales bacterium]